MTKIMKGGIAYNSTANMVALTQAEYDALTTAQKNNGNFYFITDADPSYFGAENIDYDNTSSGLSATNIQSAIDEVYGDIPTNASELPISSSDSTDTKDYIDNELQGKQDKAVDSGWQNLNVTYSGTVENCRYRKIDNIVYVEFLLIANTLPTTWGTVLGTVPNVIKPATEISITGRGGRDFALFSISNNGNIYFLKSDNTYAQDNRLTFSIVYCM